MWLPAISTSVQVGHVYLLLKVIFKQLKDTIEIAEYGILTPMNNETRLIEAMTIIMNDTKLRNNYSKNALKRANDFNVDKIIPKYEAMLLVIAGGLYLDECQIETIIASLVHRGIDEQNYTQFNHLSLKHTRLAIQDICSGQQPYHYGNLY